MTRGGDARSEEERGGATRRRTEHVRSCTFTVAAAGPPRRPPLEAAGPLLAPERARSCSAGLALFGLGHQATIDKIPTETRSTLGNAGTRRRASLSSAHVPLSSSLEALLQEPGVAPRTP